MKRITNRLAITFCTFVIGVCAVAIYINSRPTNTITSVVENRGSKLSSTPLNNSSITKKASDITALCNRISEIKYLNPKNEAGYDDIYDALIEAGESVVPCLISKITDTTIMPDPRGIRISQETKVGDVAYFVLIDVTKLDFIEMLPDKVKLKYKTEGAYAYHDYIERKGNRKKLQQRLLERKSQEITTKIIRVE